MQIPRYEFANNIQIVNLGDIHRGDSGCDVGTLRRHIEYIRKNDNVRWVSTGDMMNCALKNSKSDVYNSLSPQVELEALSAELEPIAGKCLGFVSSNHHHRVTKETGLDLDKNLSKMIGIPYLGKLGLLNVKVGAGCYFIAMHHGTGGGGMRGGKINALSRLSRIVPGADVYLEGHTHAYATFINAVPHIDKKRNLFNQQRATFVTTGHYLQWENSYAQDMKLEPMPIGAAMIELIASDSGRNDSKKVRTDFLD